jgi:hypothetical protein
LNDQELDYLVKGLSAETHFKICDGSKDWSENKSTATRDFVGQKIKVVFFFF